MPIVQSHNGSENAHGEAQEEHWIFPKMLVPSIAKLGILTDIQSFEQSFSLSARVRGSEPKKAQSVVMKVLLRQRRGRLMSS